VYNIWADEGHAWMLDVGAVPTQLAKTKVRMDVRPPTRAVLGAGANGWSGNGLGKVAS